MSLMQNCGAGGRACMRSASVSDSTCVCECARASCLCHRGRALKLRSRCTCLELRQPFALFRSLIRGRWQHALRELQRWDSFVAWVKIAVITAFAYRCHGLNTISVAASYPVGRSRPCSRRLGPAELLCTSRVMFARDRCYRLLLSGIKPCGRCCTVCRSLSFAPELNLAD